MIRFVFCTVALVVALAAPARAAQWDPNAWVKEDTINILTVGPEEGPHDFPVWLVVIDGQVYLRLGSRAAERFNENTTKPFVGVKIAGQEFAKIRVQEAPEMEQRVAKAMSDKYTSDIFVRYFSHPLTVRLLNE
jgi:hypothetical protein